MSPPARAMTPADLTDARLAADALAGDRDAFTELFSRHESGLFNVAYRLTGSREDAADITQEAFLRVFGRLDDLAGREINLAAYLHRTARNLVYDRSAQHGRETLVDEMEGAAGADTTLEADPQLATLVGAQGDDVRAANARLPERHRLALALRELEGMGYEDIGRVLDITPGAVAQLLARARVGLRRELRIQQVDVAAMDPGCRSRLGDIGALIDGELDPDRAHVLGQHMDLCASCQATRAAFDDTGRRYRAWLPLPVLLGLGADTARAAESRRLVRFSDAGRRGAGSWRAGAGGGAGGVVGSRRRAVGAVGAGVLAIVLLVAVPALVASRSGSSPDPDLAPFAADGATTPATGTTTPVATPAPAGAAPVNVGTTQPGTTSGAPAPAAPSARAPIARAPVAGAPIAPAPAEPATPSPRAATTTAPDTAATPVTPARTTRRPPRTPTVPSVTGVGDPVAPPATPPVVAPPVTEPETPPTRTDVPGTTTTRPPRDPGPVSPPTTSTPTRPLPPDIPFPTTFTIIRPPIVVN